MQIVKKLNLNKSPQYTEQGSLVFAKNIKVSPDGNYLMTEEGFKTVLESLPTAGDEIVGLIPTDKEIIVFLKNEKHKTYSIQRYNEEDKELKATGCVWAYSGGTIVGTYCYNIKGELIIAVGEYGDDIKVPLKIINLNKQNTSENNYSIAPIMPIINVESYYKVRGSSMPQGIYQLFIRFEVSTDYYTKWQPIGIPLYALNQKEETIINHNRSEEKVLIKTLVNSNQDSFYNFKVNLSFDNKGNYKNYQIGYILQHDNNTVCRIWNKYSIDTTSFVFNAANAKEGNIEEFTEVPFNLYNVKNLTTYDNKLYVSNFLETDANVSYTKAIENFVKAIQPIPTKNKIEKTNLIYENFVDYLLDISHVQVELKKLLAAGDFIRINLTDSLLFDIVNKTRIHYYNKFKINQTDNVHELDDIYLEFSTKGKDIKFCYNEGSTKSTQLILVNDDPDQGDERVDILLNYCEFNSYKDTTDFTDTTIKSLQPNQVYSFYVHFVREDGSVTNGYRLSNGTSSNFGTTIDLSKKLKDIEPYNNFDFMSNNYGYELLNNGVAVESTATGSSESAGHFGYYKNIDGNLLFKAPELRDNTQYYLGVKFKVNNDYKLPSEFIGYCFSYEKVESLVTFEGITLQSGIDNVNTLTSTEAELGLSPLNGVIYNRIQETDYTQKYKFIQTIDVIDNSVKYLSFVNVNFIGRDKRLVASIYNPEKDSDVYSKYIAEGNERFQVIIFNTNIYTNKTKVLIPFGKIQLFKASGYDYYEGDFNYPSFVVTDKHLAFNKNVNIGEDGRIFELSKDTYSYDTDKNELTGSDLANYASLIEYTKYSNYNLAALQFKIEPQYKGYVKSGDKTVYLQKVVTPQNSKDLFELKGTFIEQPTYVYTNYDPERESQEEKTSIIRRSNVIADESVTNNWLYFKANNYKVINKDKRNITNLCVMGDKLLIHTENTLLLLDNSSNMKMADKTIALEQRDMFDKEPTEVLDSSVGWGGLQLVRAWCKTNKGYFYLDSDNNAIFRFADKLEEISLPIKKFLLNYKIEDAYFANDVKNNRVLVCLNPRKEECVTLSIDTNTGNFVSIHDYRFDYAVNTKIKLYLWGQEKTDNIFTLDDDLVCYYDALYKETNLFTKLSEVISSQENHDDEISLAALEEQNPTLEPENPNEEPTEAPTTSPESTPTSPVEIIQACCLDIIINEGYDASKVLNAISYILFKIKGYSSEDDDAMAEEILSSARLNILNSYSGDYIRIYTDSTDTNYININVESDSIDKINESFKLPFYDKGSWNLNYFRNNISQFIKDRTKPYNKVNPLFSDDMSLIYGKYIVVRFVCKCNDNNHIKFENLSVLINKY